MKAIFKQLIVNFHKNELPVTFKRDIDIPKLPENVRKAIVFVGMRRVGKTRCMYQRMQEIMAEKQLPKQALLYINFEDERLAEMTAGDFQSLLDAYYELYPEYTNSEKCYFFFDEIHEIPGWEKFIRRLLDSESMQIYLSGSSAKLLSIEIASSLRGRCITREIFPLSFSEFLRWQDKSFMMPLSDKERAIAMHAFEDYMKRGGFPEVLQVDDLLQKELVQDYMNTVIYRDVIERHNIPNAVAVHNALMYCLRNPAGLLSVNKLYNTLKSRGISVGRMSIYEYISFFEDAYCLFSVPCYSFSLSKAELKPKKIYPIDSSVVLAYSVKPDFEYAALLETMVFNYFRRQTNQIYYYKNEDGSEVDFLIHKNQNKYELYQVCTNLKDEKTYKREVNALFSAMKNLKLSHAYIITHHEYKIIENDGLTIECQPLVMMYLNKLNDKS